MILFSVNPSVVHSDWISHTSFQDLIPIRQRSDAGELSLDRPNQEVVDAQTEKTKNALSKLVSGALAAQNPKNVQGLAPRDAKYVRYTPANQMGSVEHKNDRIMKIVERYVRFYICLIERYDT